MPRIAALVAVLILGLAMFYHFAATPPPASAGAPAADFSAGRAMTDIAAMAPVPHPIGSPANAKVRDYLVARMAAMGLSPRIQRDEGQRASPQGGEMWIAGGHVENVIGVLPGRDPSLPAIALMAHHDSVPGSPGAADDITGVADAVEIVRAIKAAGQPRRDVMLVITDGEEADLLGATAFFADDPAAKHVGFVFNLEARGGGGRAAMFETGPANGGAIDVYRRTAKRASANSLSVFLYKLLPNDTDYSVAKAAGVPGLNFAFIGRQFDYHSPSSTVAVLDQGSVQQMGEQALGPAKALAFSPTLPARTADAVYGNLVGDFVLGYPAWVGWPILAAIAGLIAVAAFRARRAGRLGWLDVLQGAGAAMLLVTGGALALHLTRSLTGVGFGWIEGRALLARFPMFEIAMALAMLASALLVTLALALGEARFMALLVIAAAGLACSALGGLDTTALIEAAIAGVLAFILLGRQASLTGTWIGMLTTACLVTLGLQIAAPTTAFLFGWPLAAGAVVAVLVTLPNTQVIARWTVAVVLMVLVVAWTATLAHSLLEAMDVPELPALALLLAALSLWPVAWPRARLINASIGVLALGGAVTVALWLNFTSPWTPRHPRVAEPLYVTDVDGHAWRASPFEPDPWTAGVLRADGGKIARMDFPTFRHPLWAAPARSIAPSPPAIDVAKTSTGVIRVHVAMKPGDTLELDLRTDAVVKDAAVDGRAAPLLARPGKWTHLYWTASPGGVTAAFEPLGHGGLDIKFAEYTPSWPAAAKPLPPMPAALMPWDMAGSTVATGGVRSTW